MATRNLAQMSSRKLRALLEVEQNEEVKVEIQAILDERAEVPDDDDEETPAEAEAEPKPKAEKKKAKEKPEKKEKPEPKPKATEEEFSAMAVKAKEAVYHRCTVKVKGTAVDLPGVITGVLEDKRSMSVYHVVQLDPIEGVDEKQKNVFKKLGSDEIQIMDETVLRTKAEKGKKLESRRRSMGLSQEDYEKVIDRVVEKAEANVGHKFALPEGKEGRIVGLVRDRRNGSLYYRVQFEDETGMNKSSFRTVGWDVTDEAEVYLLDDDKIDPDFDEAADEIAQKYLDRKNREPKVAKTLEEKILQVEESLKRAKNALLKAEEAVASREASLRSLKAQYDAQLASENQVMEEAADKLAQDVLDTAAQLDGAEAEAESLE